MKQSSRKGLALVLLSAVFFGTEYLLFDAVYQKTGLATSAAMFWSLLTTSIFLTPVVLTRQTDRIGLVRTLKKNGSVLLIISAISVIGIFLIFWSIEVSNSGIASLLYEQFHLFSVICLGVIFLGERLNGEQTAGMAIALAGIYFLANLKGEVSPLVVIAVALAGFTYALQSLIVKKYAPGLDGMPFVYARTIMVTVLWSIGMVALEQEITLPAWSALGLLFLAGVSGTFISQIFYFEAHNLLPISTLNVYSLFQPVFVLVGSVTLLNAPLSLFKVLGALLILAGLLLVTHGQARTAPAATTKA